MRSVAYCIANHIGYNYNTHTMVTRDLYGNVNHLALGFTVEPPITDPPTRGQPLYIISASSLAS